MSVSNPCKDCKDRKLGCHSKCDKYSEFKNKIEEIKEERIKQNFIDDYRITKVERTNKKMRK